MKVAERQYNELTAYKKLYNKCLTNTWYANDPVLSFSSRSHKMHETIIFCFVLNIRIKILAFLPPKSKECKFLHHVIPNLPCKSVCSC